MPRILNFSVAIGADYSFELISIVHLVPQFIGHNKIFLGSVNRSPQKTVGSVKRNAYKAKNSMQGKILS